MNDDLLAKRIFLAGLAGLPWLWICNVIHFRTRVFDPLPIVDYWPWDGQGKSDAYGRRVEARMNGDNNNGNDDGNNDGNDDAGIGEGGSRPDGLVDGAQTAAMIRAELEKWVRRSTVGAVVVVGAFVAWIVAFQANRDRFGPKWFVMNEDEYEATGW